MARLRLGAVSLAVLLIAFASTSLAAPPRGPLFSDTIWLDGDADAFRLLGQDLDDDGAADLATVNWNSSTVSVYRSKGDGNFAKRIDYRTALHPAGVAAADVNGDARPDLITVSHDRSGSVTVLLNTGGGRFLRTGTYASAPHAFAAVAADVNADGIVDLLSAHHGDQQLAVLIGIGDGRFHGAVRHAGGDARNLAAGDLNRDGNLDVVLATRGKTDLAVRLGRGDGSFGDPRNYKVDSNEPGVAIGDLNQDQIPDVATAGAYITVMLGNGDGSLRRGWRTDGDFGTDYIATGDLDGDGDLDLFTALYPPLLLGDGKGRFRPGREIGVGTLDLGEFTGDLVVADFNSDTRPDVANLTYCDYDCGFTNVLVNLNWTGLPAPPCVVPRLNSNMPAADLRDAGCRMGRVTHRFSRRVPKGFPIAQDPKSGVFPTGTRVDVVMSRGPRHPIKRKAEPRRDGPIPPPLVPLPAGRTL